MKYYLLILLVSCAFSVSAQTSIVDTTVVKMSAGICNCITKEKMSSLDEKKGQAVFMRCMMDSAGPEFIKMLSDENAGDAGKKFGEDIAMQLFSSGCQEFVKFSLNIAKKEMNNEDKEEGKAHGSIKGTFIRTEAKDLLTIFLKDASGREHSALVIRYFDGSDKFLLHPENYKGKKVEVTFDEVEVYNPRAKDFVKRKEVTGISIIKK